MELYVSDTELTVYPKKDICYAHVKAKEKMRLTDGQKHPVKIIKKGGKNNG